ncbi:MAG: 2-amino-4-hydroxy-6-hydroxymethyldihydropteridine diphosphokinase [Streptomycetales bacterium]
MTGEVTQTTGLWQGPRSTVISLGSNLGNRLETLQSAVDALADTPGVQVTAVSPVYETEPVGGPEQPEYFNAIVIVESTISVRLLLERGHAIEDAFRRPRTERWGPRTIDVDVITYGDETSEDPTLTLPHPRAHERAFVLQPWHDVDPEAVLPGYGPVAGLLQSLGGVLRRRDDLELRLPE